MKASSTERGKCGTIQSSCRAAVIGAVTTVGMSMARGSTRARRVQVLERVYLHVRTPS